MKSRTIKKMTSFLFATVFMFGVIIQPVSATVFNDVKSTDWYYTAVTQADNKGYMTGTGINKFEPNAPMTRAMFVQALANYSDDYNPENYREATKFSDVAVGSWYNTAVNWAYSNGVVYGTSNTTFSPGSNITRQEIMVMLYNYAKATGNNTCINPTKYKTYADKSKVATWAEAAVAWSVNRGIVSGTSISTISPLSNAKRSEIAAMLINGEKTLTNRTIAHSEFIVISHRGSTIDITEHSFEAYDQAIGYGSKYIELDLVSSKDGTLYVSHDFTATLAGSDKAYADMTDAEINTLKLENGENVPTLTSVFNRYGKSINYVIELRQGAESHTENFISIVQSFGLQDYIIAQSFHINPLLKVRYAFNNMKTMLLSITPDNLDSNLKNLEIDIVCINVKNMTQANVDAIHNAQKDAFAYTVNDTEDLDRLMAWGINGVFTDKTKDFLAHLGQ